MSLENEPLTPGKHKGSQKDYRSEKLFDDETTASEAYRTACRRLLDVNGWHSLITTTNARFTLTDQEGHQLHEPVSETGQLIRISIPGPDNDSPTGCDWAKVEALMTDGHAGDAIVTAFRVRPCPDPTASSGNTAHFLSDDATSTFSVERRGARLAAIIQGRNEHPNDEAQTLLGRLRDKLVGISAIAGIADLQWQPLAEAIAGN